MPPDQSGTGELRAACRSCNRFLVFGRHVVPSGSDDNHYGDWAGDLATLFAAITLGSVVVYIMYLLELRPAKKRYTRAKLIKAGVLYPYPAPTRSSDSCKDVSGPLLVNWNSLSYIYKIQATKGNQLHGEPVGKRGQGLTPARQNCPAQRGDQGARKTMGAESGSVRRTRG